MTWEQVYDLSPEPKATNRRPDYADIRELSRLQSVLSNDKMIKEWAKSVVEELNGSRKAVPFWRR